MNLDMVVRRIFWKVEIREDKSNEGGKIAFFSNLRLLSFLILCLCFVRGNQVRAPMLLVCEKAGLWQLCFGLLEH